MARKHIALIVLIAVFHTKVGSGGYFTTENTRLLWYRYCVIDDFVMMMMMRTFHRCLCFVLHGLAILRTMIS